MTRHFPESKNSESYCWCFSTVSGGRILEQHFVIEKRFSWMKKNKILFTELFIFLWQALLLLLYYLYIEIVLQEIFLGLLPSVLRHHLQMVSMWNIIIGAIIIRIIIQRDFGREKKKKAFYKNYFSALRFILLYINIIFILL